jgi:putative mRNA 3-end processing factor
LITVRDEGLFFARGDFSIAPCQPVKRALITHAHADHAYPGRGRYLATRASIPILKHRLGEDISIEGMAFGETRIMGETEISFHPAGHVLGSAQVRVSDGDEVWAVSGDYKRSPDPTCRPFEVVPCDHFITEATFGLPVYTWEPGEVTAKKIYQWWQSHTEGVSVLFCYAFGKAQRVLAELTRFTDRKVYLHGAMTELTRLYREQGVAMVPTQPVADLEKGYPFKGELILAPPSAHRSPWMKRFKNMQTGFASGWMRVRGNRRRRGYERGFVLSDHADWPELVATIEETGARKVWITHGRNDTLARYLREEKNIEAAPLETLFEGEA